MLQTKEKIKEKRGGEKQFDIKLGDNVYVKGVNTRRSKDKPRYQKAKIIEEPNRNIVMIETPMNKIKRVPAKDIKRPSQVRPGDGNSGSPKPGPSTTKD
ncbi:unnamed protein product [Arctia plantaginis]|nr:unnamed protein product [Arctia plantaginis]